MKIATDPAMFELLDMPGNPAPPNASVTSIETGDGVRLRVATWMPGLAGPGGEGGRGTVLLLQGRAEFVEKYHEVAGELLGRGFAVVAFDWRGQGRSGRALPDGRKGHVRHFDDFLHDLRAVEAEVLPRMPAPVFGLAHSMGGCIALGAAARGSLPVARLVAATPMVALSVVRRPRAARILARLLGAIGLSARFVPGGRPHSISTEPFGGNRLSSDEARYARNAAVALALGEGAIGAPTIGWIRAAYEAMSRFDRPGYGATIRIPTLILAAGDDPVCSTPAVERFARTLGRESRYLSIPGSRHEIMMETDDVRSAFWDAFDGFVPGPVRTGASGEWAQDDVLSPVTRPSAR